MKVCFKCHTQKPLADFYPHPKMADGHLNKCITCTKKDVQDRYNSQRDKIREYEKRRSVSAERKAKLIEYQRSSRIRNAHKWAARVAVHNAIKAGVLTRRPCEVCGIAKVEAHHVDYDRPLDVQWLCFKHHREAHGHVVAA